MFPADCANLHILVEQQIAKLKHDVLKNFIRDSLIQRVRSIGPRSVGSRSKSTIFRGYDRRNRSVWVKNFHPIDFEFLNQITLFFQIMIKMFQNILIVESF